jgi:starch synthase (maltosyl-transferring)
LTSPHLRGSAAATAASRRLKRTGEFNRLHAPKWARTRGASEFWNTHSPLEGDSLATTETKPRARASKKAAPTGSIGAKFDGRRRVVIESVDPELDGGEFAIQRVVGDKVKVKADIFADGHDAIAAQLLYRRPDDRAWRTVRMEPAEPKGMDRWGAEFVVETIGEYRYTIEGWADPFTSWRNSIKKRLDAGQEAHVDLMAGGILAGAAVKRAKGEDAKRLKEFAARLNAAGEDEQARKLAAETALDPLLESLMQTYQEHAYSTRYEKELIVAVSRERAAFSAWYEIFPRSCSLTPGVHGTFKDVEGWLPYIQAMNFDVLYFPPIHPIAHSFRKGKNNAEAAGPEDVGSPWAIGSEEGGHKAIHPRLGTLDDFTALIAKAKDHGLEMALDLAFQCSPDHPYVREHPGFFRKRPDGTIQYAENPPKKYQDIYPLDFVTDEWRELWSELKSIVDYWIDQGVKIFRVDNPHTKSFSFWKWLISETRAAHPEVIFLAEAFTRPRVMYRLAKLGFQQSYTYFTWRNTKEELIEYLQELTETEVAEFFRPNFWPNTPDILHAELQQGGRPAFMSRFVLAATLASNYGIYGPAFELCENRPIQRGSEEYLDSEKYQLRHWDIEGTQNLQTLIARVNKVRQTHPALHRNLNLHFHRTDQPFLICYSKMDADEKDRILTIVNLHHGSKQAGWVDLDLKRLGLEGERSYQVHDLLTDQKYDWTGERNYVELDAGHAHIFHIPSPDRNA